MVLESTVICVDNSEYMRNGDFVPTRLLAQQDAVNMVCTSKTRANPENTVALLTLSSLKVLSTLTNEVGKVMSCLHQIEPEGEVNFLTGIKVAQLALKHRQSKNHKTRIVLFVGSPIEADEKDLQRLAKKLKKEKVNVDIVNFGETNDNTDKLTNFVSTLNGKEGTGSHIVTVSVGPSLSDALKKSPILSGDDMGGMGSSGFDFIDANQDPDLALALRVSLEEQRQRQEEENKSSGGTVGEGGSTTILETPISTLGDNVDLSQLSEEEQIALAMQMSLAGVEDDMTKPSSEEVTPVALGGGETVEDDLGDPDVLADVMADPEFLQQVLTDLPGVDASSEAVKSVMGNIQKGNKNKKDKEGDDEGESAPKKPRKDN